MSFDYWLNLVPHRPPYVVLCNFDEFWIYAFNTELHEPVDRVPVADLLTLPKKLREFRVLDPACGSGNFLFVAYRAARSPARRTIGSQLACKQLHV